MSAASSAPQRLREITPTAGESAENKKRYEEVLRESVAEVVKMQAQAGIDIVNDGEFGKSSWANYILERTTGFEHRPNDVRPIQWLGRDLERFPDVMATEFPTMKNGMPTEACVGPIRYGDHASIDRDIRNLKDALKSVKVEEAFLPVVAPASAVFNGINEHYPTEKEYVYAVAEALREEYRAIYEAGIIVQIDDAVLANMYDHYVQQSPEKYRAVGRPAHRGSESCFARNSRRPRPLPRLLRQLARAASRGRPSGRNRRLHPERARRRLFDRSRQSAART